LFYRGVELLRAPDAPSATRAAQLLRTAATGYRQMGHHDVLPAALGAWAEAERLCHRTDAAVALAREAAELLDGDAPSLLNESIVYLAWQRALSAAVPHRALDERGSDRRPRALRCLARGSPGAARSRSRLRRTRRPPHGGTHGAATTLKGLRRGSRSARWIPSRRRSPGPPPSRC